MTADSTSTNPISSNSQKEKITRGIAFSLTGGIMWGFSGTCGQYLFTFKHLNPTWLTAARMILAGILLLAFGFSRQKEAMVGIVKNKKDFLHLALFAVFGLMLCQFTYLTAISHSNAGTATVLQYLGPVLIMLVSCAAAMRLPTKRETTAVLLALCGTFLLATHGNLRTLVISPKGLFWGLSSAVTMTFYTIIPGRIIRKWGSTAVTGYAMLIGGLFLGLITGCFTSPITFDLGTVLGILAIAIIGTALAFTFYLQGVNDIGSVKASMLACVEPVSATLFSAAWLGTAFTGSDILGLAAIITTVLLLTKKNS